MWSASLLIRFRLVMRVYDENTIQVQNSIRASTRTYHCRSYVFALWRLYLTVSMVFVVPSSLSSIGSSTTTLSFCFPLEELFGVLDLLEGMSLVQFLSRETGLSVYKLFHVIRLRNVIPCSLNHLCSCPDYIFSRVLLLTTYTTLIIQQKKRGTSSSKFIVMVLYFSSTNSKYKFKISVSKTKSRKI